MGLLVGLLMFRAISDLSTGSIEPVSEANSLSSEVVGDTRVGSRILVPMYSSETVMKHVFVLNLSFVCVKLTEKRRNDDQHESLVTSFEQTSATQSDRR